jgi:hypothetical protein
LNKSAFDNKSHQGGKKLQSLTYFFAKLAFSHSKTKKSRGGQALYFDINKMVDFSFINNSFLHFCTLTPLNTKNSLSVNVFFSEIMTIFVGKLQQDLKPET